MGKIKALGLIFLLLLFAEDLFPQETKIDSLKRVLATAASDTGRLNCLVRIYDYYYFRNRDSGMKYLDRAIALSEKINFIKGLRISMIRKGGVYSEAGDFKTAKMYYDSLIKFCEKEHFSPGLAEAYGLLGIDSYNQGRYEQALQYQLQALRYARETNDVMVVIAPLGNIGNIYLSLGNYPKATEYYLEALRLLEQIKDNRRLATLYSNTGVIYYYQKKYDKALEYYFKSINISKEKEDAENVANSYGNIGQIYNIQKKNREALEFYKKARAIMEATGKKGQMATSYQQLAEGYMILGEADSSLYYFGKAMEVQKLTGDSLGYAQSLLSIGSYYFDKGSYDKALHDQLAGLRLMQNSGAREAIKNAYEVISRTYYKLGDYKKAYDYSRLFTQLKDSLMSREDMDKMASMKANFEIEKKEKERELMDRAREAEQKQAILRQKTITWSVTAGGCVMLLFALVALRGYQQKKKANEQITEQKHVIEEKNKSILDSINYSKNIQQAILPSEKNFRKYLPDSFILYKPKDIVSGDFYFVGSPVTNFGDKLVIFGVADCTGHGVPGAFLTLLGKTFIQLGLSEKSVNDCASALNYLNNGITEILDKRSEEKKVRDGMDIALCAINNETMTLEFAGAKNGVIICRNMEINELKGDKHAIGELNDQHELPPYANKSFKLQKGDVIYVYSDGFVDQFGGKDGKKFKSKNLQKLLLQISARAMNEQKDLLEKTFAEWKGELEQIDDICVIGVRV